MSFIDHLVDARYRQHKSRHYGYSYSRTKPFIQLFIPRHTFVSFIGGTISVADASNCRMGSFLLVFSCDFNGFLLSSTLMYSYRFTNLLFHVILLRVYLDGVGFSEIYLFKIKGEKYEAVENSFLDHVGTGENLPTSFHSSMHLRAFLCVI